ncbi:histonelysine Nmethyltransferase SETMARlike [Trichonephila clavipes]|nr:histonelysine Nmethyltransferase SETMARlike [Trichonephila clavipes]
MTIDKRLSQQTEVKISQAIAPTRPVDHQQVKETRTGRPIVENVDKMTEVIEDDRHVSSCSIAQEPKIDHKTVLNCLSKVGFKKKLHVWVPHQLRPKKHNGSNFHLRSLDLHCQQLDNLKLVIDQKWPELVNRRGVVLHQDNARPQTFVVTRQKLWELGWEVLMHPPYSPDLTTRD